MLQLLAQGAGTGPAQGAPAWLSPDRHQRAVADQQREPVVLVEALLPLPAIAQQRAQFQHQAGGEGCLARGYAGEAGELLQGLGGQGHRRRQPGGGSQAAVGADQDQRVPAGHGTGVEPDEPRCALRDQRGAQVAAAGALGEEPTPPGQNAPGGAGALRRRRHRPGSGEGQGHGRGPRPPHRPPRWDASRTDGEHIRQVGDQPAVGEARLRLGGPERPATEPAGAAVALISLPFDVAMHRIAPAWGQGLETGVHRRQLQKAGRTDQPVTLGVAHHLARIGFAATGAAVSLLSQETNTQIRDDLCTAHGR